MGAKRISQVALLVFALTVSARAQPSPGAEVVLPPRLVASEPATLAVLDTKGRLAPGSTVELWNGGIVVTDATGRARFTAPAAPGVMRAWLAKGKTQAAAVVFPSGSGAAPGVHLLRVPQLISRDDRFFVLGTGIAGDADGNRVLLGGKPALVLAASPEALVILPNRESPLGATRLEVGAATASVTVVAVEPVSAPPQLAPGQRAKMRVRVLGTDLPVELEARSRTPETVKLPGGNLRCFRTSGGTDNGATLELESLRPGEFRLDVRIVDAALRLPDTEAARQALVEARRLGPRSQARQLDHFIEELSRHPKQHVRVRDRLEEMLAEQPPGKFSDALGAAYEILRER